MRNLVRSCLAMSAVLVLTACMTTVPTSGRNADLYYLSLKAHLAQGYALDGFATNWMADYEAVNPHVIKALAASTQPEIRQKRLLAAESYPPLADSLGTQRDEITKVAGTFSPASAAGRHEAGDSAAVSSPPPVMQVERPAAVETGIRDSSHAESFSEDAEQDSIVASALAQARQLARQVGKEAEFEATLANGTGSGNKPTQQVAAPNSTRKSAPPRASDDNPQPADPIQAIEGEWLEMTKKIKVIVENGTIKIVENNSSHPAPPGSQYEVGRVLAELNSHQEKYGMVILNGRCWSPGGGPGWRMNDCVESAKLLNRKTHSELYVPVLYFKRANHFTSYEMNARE